MPKHTIPKGVKISAVVISLIYPIFGGLSEGVMGVLAMLLCLSTVLLFVGGVSRLICGLTSEHQGATGLLNKRLQNGSPVVATLFLCTINAIVIGAVYLISFTI